MRDNQGWATYASNDIEGLKALVLGRSLRQSITRRQLIIFISSNVTEDVWKLLQDEFDRCIKITEAERELEFRNKPFNIIAQACCLKLKRIHKFVYLDCNCIILKNADKLFKTEGCLRFKNVNGEKEISVIAGKPGNNKEDNFKTKDLQQEVNYFTHVDLQGNIKLTGNEIKGVSFVESHPLDFIVRHKQPLISEMCQFGQHLVKFCMDLLNVEAIPCQIQSNGTTFAAAVKLGQEHLNKTQNVKTLLRNQEILDDLKDSVAIVGMSFRFPGANTIDEFWDLLINGKDGIIRVPEGRWNNDQCFSRHDNTKDTQAGFLKCPIDMIDGKFFGLNAAELVYMDPQQRLCLQVVWEALENAGVSGNGLKETQTGVFGGWWRNDYKEILQEAGLNETEFFRAYMGNALGTVTGRISHCLELTGPSISTESGCSTSIVAVDMACNSLLEEKCDMALAVGVNLLIHPFSIESMTEVIAIDGHCKTFDAKADGFGRAEGCAVLVLKRFADAAADGDNIWGVIRGSAVVQEGVSRSLGTPTVQCEALAMSLALERAGVEAKDVSFVETHGTGTPVGDPLEVAAVAKVYSQGRTDVLTIGSVKTNIGHTESVSGIAGIVKTILSLQNEIIPQHLNLETLNPEINLDAIPAQIPLSPVEWKKVQNKPRIAGVSSFGITGTDAHVIIQETPEIVNVNLGFDETRTVKCVTVSAKSSEALEEYLEIFKKYLQTTTDTVEDIEYTSHLARSHFANRATIIGANKEEMIQNLKKKTIDIKQALMEVPKLCFIFTGQGSQHPRMAYNLYETSLVFRSHFEFCENLLNTEYNISIKDVLWGDATIRLSRTLYSQTSIFCIEYCLLKLWESWGVKPSCVIGHSLGEFAAAVSAEILSFEDALKLVVTRSKLIDALPQGKMLVMKENVSTTKSLMNKAFEGSDMFLDIAAVNTPEQTVLAGDESSASIFVQYCEKLGIKVHMLEATHAFHSKQMDIILKDYKTNCEKITFHPQTVEFISGMDGKIIKQGEINSDYWVRHTREKVNFLKASKVALESGYTHFLEIGPNPVLSAMILINADSTTIIDPVFCFPSIRKKVNEWETMIISLSKLYLSGVEINWENYHRYSNNCKVNIPTYPFQLKSNWIDLKNTGTTPFHPLVGCSLQNPSSLKLFSSSIQLAKTLFLKDHVLGSKVIFPGAGFLEMCLASGHSAIQCTEQNYFKPNSALTIENFRIEAPLLLNKQEPNQLQTVVSTDDTGHTGVTVYSKLVLDNETSKWVKHATAQFSPFGSKWDEGGKFLYDSLENIKIRCNTEVKSNELSYNKLEEIGLKFGKTFQTVEKCWKGDGEILVQVKVTDNPKRYICHPVMIDSMFQAVMGLSKPEGRKLQVPIAINKFVWLGNIPENENTCYVYCAHSKKGEVIAIMMNADGTHVAVMVGPELVETSVINIMSLIESQRLPLPNMLEDIWREQLGPFERRKMEDISEIVALNETNGSNLRKAEESGKYGIVTEQDKLFFNDINSVIGLYMTKCLHDLELKFTVGQKIDINSLVQQLNISSELKKLFTYIFLELAETEGYFKIITDDPSHVQLEVQNVLPDETCVASEILEKSARLKAISPVDIECAGVTGMCLSDILTGRQIALSLLFPEDGKVIGPAEMFYYNSKLVETSKQQSCELFPPLIKTLQITRTSKTVTRVLEIGSGTGSFTSMILPHFLKDGAANYEYTYTDISPAFFSKGEKIFQSTKMKVHYKVLNIEEEPATQGFIPHHYDLVLASYVLHATKDIEKSLINARNLLAPGGIIMLTEFNKPYRAVNIQFGTLPGFWRFQDLELRRHNCELDVTKWGEVFTKLGFQDYGFTKTFNSYCAFMTAVVPYGSPTYISNSICLPRKTWIVFSDSGTISQFYIRKLLEMDRKVIVAVRPGTLKLTSPKTENLLNLEVEHTNPSDILKAFNAANHEQDLEGLVYLWSLECVSQENNLAEVVQPFLYSCQMLVNKDIPIKLLVITKGTTSSKNNIVTSPSSTPIVAMARVLYNENSNLIVKTIDLDPSINTKNGAEEGFAEFFHIDGEICVSYRNNRRLVKRCIPYKPTNTALKFPNSKYFNLKLPSSLAISDLRFGPCELPALQNTEVEIQIKAYALNFRDILAVMKPDPVFESLNTVGIDYAGIVSAVGSNVSKLKIGDAVFGINLKGGAMPSHAHVDEEMVVPVPDHITLWEAASLPAIVATAYVCLVETAKLKKEDTVLIHTASGGVGLAAIQIAQQIGATIVATAGSERKRAYLRNLGIKHIFHSRNTNYEKEILEALGGNNVDVVLNSLTGEGFKEASLAVCNNNARFIEMSKMNIWTKEEVYTLRPDVQYEVVDLSAESDESLRKLFDKVKDLVEKNSWKPIPYVRCDAAEIREAMNYLQKAKHIGKIVCVMPANIHGSSELKTPLFNKQSTYMITGGLGGIGLEVAKWMANSGAKNILLVGRNPPKEKTAQEIQKITKLNVNVVVMQCDVGVRKQCEELLQKIKTNGLPQLRGIMHAAGVLSDGLLYNQSWEKFETTYNPKVRGGWNLHDLTIDYPLEHFVMFSSAAANIGSVAQSNHSSANFFLDSLAHYRNSIGLHGTTINWGQWGQVGVAADLELIGLRPLTALQGISALEKILQSHKTQVTVLEAEFQILRKHMPSAKKYLEELKTTNYTSQYNASLDGDKFWKDYDSAETHQQKYEVIKVNICNIIRTTLKMDADEVIEENASFQDMGMDSLMMIEMKNGLQASVGKRAKITVNNVRDCKTVAQLTTRIVELISGAEELPVPTKEELIKLIREDSILSEEIKAQENFKIKPSEIKTVLLIGVSGNLGPYMLREICRKPEIQKVYCLMRDNRLFSPTDRLKQILSDKKLRNEINVNKVECISGDVAKPFLGISESVYMNLAQKVDAVFNVSVKALLSEYYCKSEHITHTRSVNVLGTKNILKFACSIKTKHVFHASTMIASATANEDGSLSENWPVEGELNDRGNTAYIISKHVSDRLMHQAVERGIPCKVFRFPFIGGDSKIGGNTLVMENMLMMRMMVYMYLEVMPARNMPFMIIPVDLAAEISLQVFFNDESPSEMYNVSNPFVDDELLLEDVAQEFGYKVKIVEFEEFLESTKKLEQQDNIGIVDMMKKVKSRQGDLEDLGENLPVVVENWLAGAKDLFLSKKLAKFVKSYPDCMRPAWEYLRNDLKFAKESGVFSKIGLQ